MTQLRLIPDRGRHKAKPCHHYHRQYQRQHMSFVRAQRDLDPVTGLIIMDKGILSLHLRQRVPCFHTFVHQFIGSDYALLQSKGVQTAGGLLHIRPPMQRAACSGQKSQSKTQTCRQMYMIKGPDQRDQFAGRAKHTPCRREHNSAVNEPGQIHSVSTLFDLYCQILPDIHTHSPQNIIFCRPFVSVL